MPLITVLIDYCLLVRWMLEAIGLYNRKKPSDASCVCVVLLLLYVAV